MPNWSNALPPPRRHAGYELRRTPLDKPLTAVITSPQMIVCDTHFWGGRTLPCERSINDQHDTIDDVLCPACLAKQPWRTHAYVAAFDHHAHSHFLFECTDAAAAPLVTYRLANGTLRGCLFTACRPKRGKNAKVEIITRAADLSKCPLPEPPDLILALSVIWRLPLPALATQPASRGRNRLTTRPEPLRAMRTQPADAGDPSRVAILLAQLTPPPPAGNGDQPT
jgi:hypothetical protein